MDSNKINMDNHAPISVLMSIYHKEKAKNLNDCLKSIYEDQELKPSEIILVQDGPIGKELSDSIEIWKLKLGKKLKYVALQQNSGLANALNVGLQYCQNELVARMDTDDISLPNRLLEQYNFMIQNQTISAISGQIEEWNEDMTKKISERNLPLDHESLKFFAKKRSPLNHPAAFFRKSAILSINGYNPKMFPEDYALWVKLIQNNFQISNIPQTILKMRVGDAIYHRRGFEFLKGELKLFKYFHQTKFINFYEYIFIITSRCIIRLAPNKIKYIAYILLRK